MTTALKLVLLFPLIGVVFGLSFGRRLPEKVVGWISSLCIGAAFVSALVAVTGFLGQDEAGVRVLLFEWISTGPVHIDVSLWLDQLTSVMVLVVTGVAFLIHIYSIGYMHGDWGFGRFFTYMNLFTFAMLLLVLGDNLAMLFIGWEGVGLCSYLLIGFWFEKDSAADAGRKAFVVNRIGDAAFITGMLALFALFGTLDIQDILHNSHEVLAGGGLAVTLITLLLFVGATGKSAQIPLHIWLPDAMEGPTPVSALIHAATMVTAGVYLVARMGVLFTMAPVTLAIVALVGALTAIVAGLIAIAQHDIKKVLAYSTVSQLGFMFLALGAGAFAVGVFHLMTHAFFKGLLFLGAGSVIHAMSDKQDMREMGGLKKHLPITHATMLIAGLALAGIPFFSGFFSKDEILFEAWAGPNGHPFFWVLGAIAAVLTGIYIFRLLYLTFWSKSRVPDDIHPHESPYIMTVPLMILAVLAALGGFIGLPHVLGGGAWIQEFIGNATGAVSHAVEAAGGHGEEVTHGSAGLQVVLMVVSVLLALTGYWIARKWYGRENPYPEVPETAVPGLWMVMRQKFYFDEFYFMVIGKPLQKASEWLYRVFDVKVIDGTVNGAGQVTTTLARWIAGLQAGNVGLYALAMAGGAVILMILLLV